MTKSKQAAQVANVAVAEERALPRSVSPAADQFEPLDFMTDMWLGRFTANLSPAALAMAYMDWLAHLELSPAKRQELVGKAMRKIARLANYCYHKSGEGWLPEDQCIEPLPQDKRFADPAWQRWPFNVISQAFLLNQQWWHAATTDVRGASQHHQDVVNFTARQYLDMLSPSNFILTNPVIQDATLKSGGMNLVHGWQKAWEDWSHSAAPDTAVEEGQFQVGKNVAVTPGKVVYRNKLIELIQYAPSTPTTHTTPLLIVPAWIMKYYILDLSPENSLVKYLVAHGYTVFMISWKNPVADDRDLSMDDYRQLGVMDAIDEVTRRCKVSKVNAVGYCLGGTLLSIAAAAMARDNDQRLASMTMFASQVDFKEPGELSLFIDESQVSFLESIMYEQGYLDTKQMAGAFQLLRSNDLIWSYRLNQYLLGKDLPLTDLMAWNADATRMPYRMHSEYLRQLFLHNDLAEGRYHVGGKAVALKDIRVPVFAVGTISDHVAPWHSVYKIQLLTDTDVTFLLTSGGHNAGVVSPPGHPHRSYQMASHGKGDTYLDADTWQQSAPSHDGSWWPAWESWLAKRSGAKKAAPRMAKALCDAPGEYILQT